MLHSNHDGHGLPFVVIVSLLLFLVLEPCVAIKECIQPIRTKIFDPICTHPQVPETIYRDYEEKSCKQSAGDNTEEEEKEAQKAYNEYNMDSSINKKEACSLVVEAIYADNPVVDVVLLNNGMCHPSTNIEKGVFSPQDVMDLLPYNNELILLRLKGKEIIQALEHGMRWALEKGITGALPKSAGIRYDFHEQNIVGPLLQGKRRKRHRLLSNFEILGPYCTWDTLENNKRYYVLTNQFLAQGGDGYQILRTKTQTTTPMGLSEADSFWFHAQSTCVLEMPWKKQDDAEAVAVAEGRKMIFKVGKLTDRASNRTLHAAL